MKTSKKTSKNNQKKNTKPLNKKIIIAGIAVLAVCAAIFISLNFIQPRNLTIAFYKIEDSQRKGISETITNIAKEKSISVNFIEYDSELSLKEQIPLTKKPSVIITRGGYALDSALEKASSKAGLKNDTTQGMTSSMRAAIKSDDGKITALPFLSSHFEVDIDLAEFRNSDTKQINTWNDVERFMREQKRKKEAPMVFAGGNPELFIDLIGAFAESIDGTQSYYDSVKILKDNEKNFNAVRVAQRLCDDPDSPLATSIKLLKAWYRQGLIHQGVFSFQKNDVEAFASSRLSSVMFMTLETHRATAVKTISRYSSIYFPSDHSANSRIFTGNTYYAIPMVKSSKADTLLTELLSVQSQEAMSRSTGVAPVLAQCRIPDKQAENARFWIAATTSPLSGLSSEVYLKKEQKTALSAEIASRIRN